MCRCFIIPAIRSGFCCLAKMNKSEQQEPTKSHSEQTSNRKPIVKEPTLSFGIDNKDNIEKPKITFLEHDPPSQPLPILANNNAENRCICSTLRSTSVGQIDSKISRQITKIINNNQIDKNELPITSPENSPSRPSTANSIFLHSTVNQSKNRKSSSSSSSSNSSTTTTNDMRTKLKSKKNQHHIHCPFYKLNTLDNFLSSEPKTHQLHASPLLGFPKAISHNEATLFKQSSPIETQNTAGLEFRRLSDSAALNSSVNKPTSSSSSTFMPTRRCVLRLDGCSYLIVANPPETTAKNKDVTSKSNETIVVRKAEAKPISGLRSLGSSSDQPEILIGSSGFETEIDNAKPKRAIITSADSMPPVDTLQACDKAASRLRELIRHIDHGQVSPEVVKKTLQYAACVLDTINMDEQSKSNANRASPKTAALLKIPSSTAAVAADKQTSDTNNNQSSLPVTRSAKKLGSIGRAVSEQVPVSSSILTSQNKATIIPSPIKSHHHPHIYSSPCTQITEHNLNATNVFHANRTDANVNRRILDEEDDLSEVQPDAVPTEVREWLATTFTRQANTQKRRLEDKPKFRSVANAIRAGIMVNRIYRSQIGPSVMQIPSDILENIKSIDNWSFDCFTLNEKAKNQSLKYVTFELMNRYGLLTKFKIPQANMENFIFQIEQGYLKNKNPYHNNVHAADVTQTVHFMLFQLGLMNWLSDLEIFATLIAAIIHDYQHNGKTNNFHVQSASDIALMYNDRAVLENFHLSTAFQVMRKEDCNITTNLSNEEYKEFRSLVIEMVLATDMNSHFQQIKAIKGLLNLPTSNLIEEKPKALSLILHCCDISHPSKDWSLHHQWTALLIEEFFQQGDEEKRRGLPFTPLCDRNTTLVPESQIGFIDFIVSPSMEVCGDLLDRIYQSLQSMSVVNEAMNQMESDNEKDRSKSGHVKSKLTSESTFDQGLTSRATLSAPVQQASSDQLDLIFIPSANNIKDGRVFRPWSTCLVINKKKWQQRAEEESKLRALKKAEEEEEEEEENKKEEEDC